MSDNRSTSDMRENWPKGKLEVILNVKKNVFLYVFCLRLQALPNTLPPTVEVSTSIRLKATLLLLIFPPPPPQAPTPQKIRVVFHYMVRRAWNYNIYFVLSFLGLFVMRQRVF